MVRWFVLVAFVAVAAAQDCIKEREKAIGSNLRGKFIPECKADGTYEAIQCHESYCFCVFPDSGEEVLGTRIRFGKPKTCELTDCVESRHAGLSLLKRGFIGGFISSCSEDGMYSSVQCRKGQCWCSFPDGTKVRGTDQVGVPKSCELTPCFKSRHSGLVKAERSLLGVSVARCKDNGDYDDIQCKEAYCWCVFPETGLEIKGTLIEGTPKTCEMTECIKGRHAGLNQAELGILGGFTPRCDSNGDFEKVQCRKGVCWCVDTKTGKFIRDTNASKPNC